MGAVDRTDQLLQPYSAARKSMKWYRKLTVHLWQVSMLNAYCLYASTVMPGQKPKTFLQFQHSVLLALLGIGLAAQTTVSPAIGDDSLVRLHGRHFIAYLPASGKKDKPTKRCRVCYARGARHETRFYCPTCPSHPALCVEKCFQLYHTESDYSK